MSMKQNNCFVFSSCTLLFLNWLINSTEHSCKLLQHSNHYYKSHIIICIYHIFLIIKAQYKMHISTVMCTGATECMATLMNTKVRSVNSKSTNEPVNRWATQLLIVKTKSAFCNWLTSHCVCCYYCTVLIQSNFQSSSPPPPQRHFLTGTKFLLYIIIMQYKMELLGFQ